MAISTFAKASRMDEEGHAVVFQDVVKVLGHREALSSVSFAVPSGTVFGLIGANGAGKTTTLRLILGFVRKRRRKHTSAWRLSHSDGSSQPAAYRRFAGDRWALQPYDCCG